MRRGTKKCILLLLAILLLCLLAWRLTPHTFEEITALIRMRSPASPEPRHSSGFGMAERTRKAMRCRTFCRRTRRLKAFLCF